MCFGCCRWFLSSGAYVINRPSSIHYLHWIPCSAQGIVALGNIGSLAGARMVEAHGQSMHGAMP